MKKWTDRARGTACGVALAIALSAAPAAAQNLCEFYTVRTGDTLSQIARTAGVAGGYQLVFNANQDVLRSPNLIEVGQRLRIPCADGSLPGVTAAKPEATLTLAQPEPAPAEPAAEETPVEAVAAVPEPEAEAAAEAAPAPEPAEQDLPTVRFLTAGAYAPFTDEDLPEQGMFTELVKTALNTADPDQDYSVTFVNDWGSHLTTLLPMGAFDMGFPWFRPDCSRIENLRPANAMRCSDFNHSEPFFEAVVSYYALKGGPFEATDAYPQLLGTRLCRPRGWFTFDLEAERLVEPNVEMLVPPTQVDCWRALLDGEVDVVTFDALPAEADIQELGISDRVVELAPLSTLATIHVFTPKSNPNGEAYLAKLNEGLAELRTSGKWFEIVSRHLTAHEEKKAQN